MIYEASISSRWKSEALRMTRWECEQIHHSGLSLWPNKLSKGWPSLEFHHWDMEHNRECVQEDKGLICQEGDKVSVCVWGRFNSKYDIAASWAWPLYSLGLYERLDTDDSLPSFLPHNDLEDASASSSVTSLCADSLEAAEVGEWKPDVTKTNRSDKAWPRRFIQWSSNYTTIHLL